MQNILHAFTEVITAESADIQLKQLAKRDIHLLSKSRSIHMLDKVEIDPRLLDTEATNEVFKPEASEVSKEDESGRGSIDFSEFVKKKQGGDEIVEFVEYAPRLFYQLRKADGVASETLQEAFDPQKNREAAFNAGESQGKSGSFFFFTHDRKFYIKTMSVTEYHVFMNMLPEYYCRCMNHRDSLIARTYGVFGLRLPGMAPLHFYLMENCLRLDKRDLIAKYDLKGSKVNREVFDEEKLEVSYTLKDENFTRRSKDEKVSLE
ncbi:MAG: hypothetical protein P4M11_03500 [Candidatus Pacebacteria bacterium]|nr:hypothetical protein [Candidatus Paceibacterota bacterium]